MASFLVVSSKNAWEFRNFAKVNSTFAGNEL